MINPEAARAVIFGLFIVDWNNCVWEFSRVAPRAIFELGCAWYFGVAAVLIDEVGD